MSDRNDNCNFDGSDSEREKKKSTTRKRTAKIRESFRAKKSPAGKRAAKARESKITRLEEVRSSQGDSDSSDTDYNPVSSNRMLRSVGLRKEPMGVSSEAALPSSSALQSEGEKSDAESSQLSDYQEPQMNAADSDDLIGQSESSNSDEEGNPSASGRQSAKQKLVPKRAPKLREGVETVSDVDVERQEADEHLPPLPNDYAWVSRLPIQKPRPQWSPSAENHPRHNQKYADRSLCSLFLEMSELALNHLLIGTNKLGRNQYPKSWPELTLPKLLLFIAIVFHMDCEKRRGLRHYWNKKKPDAFIQATGISKRKFLMWYGALRPYDPDDYSTNEKKSNKIYKVEEYLRLCQIRMQEMRKPTHQNLSLDEEMSTFKGRCGLIQIIKNKPRGEGLKYYALCDPQTGYVFSTILHSGTKIEFDRYWGRIVAFCYKLITGRPEGSGLATYIDQGYCIYTDRYYTTVHMNYAMSIRKTYFCGTLRREQRSSLPKDIMLGTRRDPIPQQVKELKRGEVIRRFSNYNDTAAISWKDNTLVTFLTSVDECTDDPLIVSRRLKTSKGRYYRLGVTQPSVAKDFSSNMGGVDIHDQLTTSVKHHHRSRRWYLSAVVLQSFDWFSANASIIYNEQQTYCKIKNCEVKERLADRLMAFVNSLEKRNVPQVQVFAPELCKPTSVLPPKPTDMDIRKMRLNRDLPHYPRKFVGKGRVCLGHCQRVSTNSFCMTCIVFLCDNGCFARFHELHTYLYDDTELDRGKVRNTQRY